MSIPINKLKDVAFTIDHPPQSLFSKGSFTVNSALTFVTIPHNLGYVPYIKVVYEYPDGSGQLRNASYTSGSYVQVLIEPTTTNVRFNAANNFGAGAPSFTSNCRIYYRIYRRTTV